ncbi:MAG TPA: APC family permease [Alphaproteobacteria bacterium]
MSAIKPLNETQRLRADSFGWVGQFFQSMAHMAPAAAVILAMQFMSSRSGFALPLACVFGMLLAVLLAYCLGLLTRKYYGASGYFQIHSQALGSRIGFTTSWLYLIYEPLNLFVTIFGFSVLIFQPFIATYLHVDLPWWSVVLIGSIIVTLLSFTDIKSSIKITGLLGLVEFIILLALGISLIWQSNEPFHPEFFLPSSSADGTGGLIFAFVFGFLCFMGYESGLPLTEETSDTQNSTFKALIWSVLIAGVFYIFIGYATIVGFGLGENSAEFAKDFSTAANPYGSSLALKAFGTIGPWLIFFAAVNSVIACTLASQNGCSRVFFALGRAGILPYALGRISNRTKAPTNAIILAFVVTLIATAVFALVSRNGNPVDWFGLAAIMLTLPLLVIHLITCIAVFIAYRYKESHDFHLLHHGIIPLITGLLVLLPIGGAVYYNQAYPMVYAPYVMLVWFIIGLFVYAYLKRNRPSALATLESEMELLAHPEKD